MNGALPSWVQRLLGIESGSGEGTIWRLEHSWPWPPWITLLLLVFAVVFVVMIYVRESRRASAAYRLGLATIRLVLVAIVLLMIAQYVLLLQQTGLPNVAVLIDDSLSMKIEDRYDESLRQRLGKRLAAAGFSHFDRLNQAKTLLSENDGSFLAAIEKNYRLRVYFLSGTRLSQADSLDGHLESIRALAPSGRTSRLGTALRVVLDDLRGTAPAAVVLLSDGINTDGPTLADAAGDAAARGVPLFAVGLGDEQPIRDLKLSDLLVEDVVFVDDVVQFEARLTSSGFAGRTVAVVLREEGKSQVLATLEVTVAADGQPQRLRLPYRPSQEGEFRYVVEVQSLEGELQTDNNRQQRTVRVSKEQIRVLLAQAYPSYEFRYLQNMLKRNKTIQLDTVLQEADLEYAEQDASALRVFPVRRDELLDYDVIILGDVDPALLSVSIMENLAEFVDTPGKGGALVLISGPRYMPLGYRHTPLARLMPVDLNSAQAPPQSQALTEGLLVQPTELGLASPPMQLGQGPADTRQIWQNLPPLYWMVEAPQLKPAVRVLAERRRPTGRRGRSLPIICLRYVGAGKVLFHATDETWRWRWRSGDLFFQRYWIQTIRYLSRSKLARGGRSATLTTDRREYRRGESVWLRVRFADERLAPAEDDGVTVVLEHQGHQTQRVKLHRTTARADFEGHLARPRVGQYHAWMAIPTLDGRAPATDFTVSPPVGELERVQMDAAELRRAAQRTRGRFYTITEAGRLPRDLPEGRQVPVESHPPKPLWNKWPLLLLFLSLLIGEWILRKAGGMV